MAIMRRDPLGDFDPFDNRVRRILRNFARDWPSVEEPVASGWNPNVDIYETQNELVVKAELPGMEQKDIQVGIENNILTLHGERKSEADVKEGDYHRMESSYGSFTRSFSLPATIEEDRVRAEFKNGVLRITLPKKPQSRRKQIDISAA